MLCNVFRTPGRGRRKREREVEWSLLKEIGTKLVNDTLTTEEKKELMDVLVHSKDLFATDI